MALSKEQTKRYSRHLVMKELGAAGQEKLQKAKVLVIGAGGLGSPAALYLAAAGVGTIGIADGDKVELSSGRSSTAPQTSAGLRWTLPGRAWSG